MVCEHLLPLEQALISHGVAITFRGQAWSINCCEWVYFDCFLDTSEIRNLNSPRYKLEGTAVRLENGKVLLAGGASRAEVFDPSSNTFSYAAGDMETTRLFATATRLRNGQVLITRGYNNSNLVSSNAWVYRSVESEDRYNLDPQ